MSDYTKNQPQCAIANMVHDLHNATPDSKESIPWREDTASQTTASNPSLSENGDVIELNSDFDFEGYQVVRREFLAHINEPSVTFTNYKVYVNAACLKRFQSVDYVQTMVNIHRKTLLLRPSREEAHDAVPWCVPGASHRKPRQITCKMLFANLFSIMGWNPDYRYKLLGKVVHARNGYFIIFDLTATEVYQCVFRESDKPKASRTPFFPHYWQDQFGLPYNEHQKSMHIDIVGGYAVYAIKDKHVVPIENAPEEPTKNLLDVAAYINLTESLNDE